MSPITGRGRPDYPKSLKEFMKLFPTDESCWRYLIASRWPHGFICPKCGEPRAYFVEARRLFECAAGHQTSVTAGTVLHRTKMPLTTWFWGAYLATTLTPGVSALQFSRQLELRYETAFQMLQKLRAGMVNPERGRLSGIIEVDETYIGGRQAGPGGRGARGKAMVVAAVERRDPNRAGRLRLRQIGSATTEHLLRFIEDSCEPGSIIMTDSLNSYLALEDTSYKHVQVKGVDQVEIAEGLPHVHRVFSNLKAWLIGTHHGVSPKHLQAYLNEFTFRFNRRRVPMAAFQTALGLGTSVPGPTYRQLYRAGWPRGWRHPSPSRSPELPG
jgi:transposase-like protein/predicted RNA-binding Zn-ribbon protein involved in translation (DUF1610 family)